MRRILALFAAGLAGAALFAAGGAVHAFAGHGTGNVPSYTGCLTPTAKLVKIKLGDEPKGGSCGAQTEVHLSGGDITAVLPGYGIDRGSGAAQGSATVSVDPSVIQNRVLKACGTDAAITQIHEDGSVDCDKDNGFRNYDVVDETGDFNSIDEKTVEADCPVGTVVVGGGGDVDGERAFFTASQPSAGPGWRVTAKEVPSHANNWDLHVFAICADIN